MNIADASLRDLSLQLAWSDLKLLMPPWEDDFRRANKDRGFLIDIVRAFAGANMNVLKTAAALGIHPNTVYGRLARIKELTGLDIRRFDALTELLMICNLSEQG